MNKAEFKNKGEVKNLLQWCLNYIRKQPESEEKEALLNRLEAESKEDLKTCDVCGSENTITVSNKGENCDWCNPL